VPVFGFASFLLASVSLYVAVRSLSTGFRAGAALAFAHALLAGVSVWALFGTPDYEDPPSWIALTWSIAALSSLVALVVAGLPVRRGKSELEVGMARRARRAWVGLAWLEGAALFSAFDHRSEMGVLVAFAVAPIVFGIGALLLIKVHRRNGDLVRVELARFMGFIDLSLVPVCSFMFLAATFGDRTAMVVFLAGLLVFLLFLPVTTAVLVGVRPPPLDLADRRLTREQAERGIFGALVVLGSAAALANGASLAWHLEACPGALVGVPEPKGWRDLPVVGKDGALGQFTVHGYTESYKNYPAALESAVLGDPKLCFGGTVSLGAWFDGSSAIYRSVGELALRRDAKTDTFVVTGTAYSNPETFIVAFQRDETRRLGFDYPEVKGYLGFGMVMVALGAGFIALWRHRIVKMPVDPIRVSYYSGLLVYLAYLGLLVALGTPLTLAFALVEKPRPGAEIFVRSVGP
jgi:hypothetical protein